eukprot:jgi/Psemu1/311807/fgenesh1_kg.832_\
MYQSRLERVVHSYSSEDDLRRVRLSWLEGLYRYTWASNRTEPNQINQVKSNQIKSNRTEPNRGLKFRRSNRVLQNDVMR